MQLKHDARRDILMSCEAAIFPKLEETPIRYNI